MPKISRPVIYAVVGAAAVYAIFLYTQPTPPAVKHTVRYKSAATTSDSDAILPEDLNAHFPRYTGHNRDPFLPGVASGRSLDLAGENGRGGWALTGINTVNGVASAVIENSTTGDSAFLQPGDHWNGLTVVAVGAEDIQFVNALGQHTTMAFADTLPDTSSKTGAIPPLTPTMSQIRPLPALGYQPTSAPAAAPGAPSAMSNESP